MQGHPDVRKTPGVEAGTGSLGQGLSIGLGMALGLRMDGIDSHVYVLMGDGEIAEGQIWEAAMAAAAYKADHLVAILDRNRLQATGRIVDRFDSGLMKENGADCLCTGCGGRSRRPSGPDHRQYGKRQRIKLCGE